MNWARFCIFFGATVCARIHATNPSWNPLNNCDASVIASTEDSKAFEEYVRLLQSDQVTLAQAPLALVRARFPDGYKPGSPLYRFESEILEMFQGHPTQASIYDFARRWGLNYPETSQILSYYGVQVFDFANRDAFFHALQQFNRDHYLRFSNDPVARRYPLYLSYLTQMSIPEIAQRFGITQGEVYRDLTNLQISIVDRFNLPLAAHEFPYAIQRLNAYLAAHPTIPNLPAIRASLTPDTGRLEIAQRLFRRGIPIADIARILDLGPSALEFILHHVNEINRGTGWNRMVMFAGGLIPEDQLLTNLHMAGLTYAQIAARLGRTEASIAGRVKELGIGRPTANRPDVYHPTYGHLKLDGYLVVGNVLRFIVENGHLDEAAIAAQLQIDPSSLVQFLKRNNLEHATIEGRRRLQLRDAREAGRMGPLERQIWAADRVLDWIVTHGRMPLDADWGTQAGRTGIRRRQFIGTGEEFGPGQPRHAERFFSSPNEAYLALGRRARQRNIPFRFLDLPIEAATPALQAEMRTEAADLILDWIARNGRTPTQTDFGSGAGRVNLNYTRFFDLYPDRSAALLDLLRRGRERGLSVRTLDFHQRGAVTEALRGQWQIEAADTYLDFVASRGRVPGESDWSEQGLNMSNERFFGTSSYRPGRSHHENRIFNNHAEGMLYIHRRARARGVPFSMLDVNLHPPVSDEIRAILRQDAADRVLDWVVVNGRTPLRKDFGMKPGETKVDETRLVGASDKALFRTRQEAMLYIKRRAVERGVRFLLLDTEFRGEVPPEIVDFWKIETADLYIDWVVRNGRLPQNADWGLGTGQVGIRRARALGMGDFQNPSQSLNRRVFTSWPEARQAILDRVRTRNISNFPTLPQ